VNTKQTREEIEAPFSEKPLLPWASAINVVTLAQSAAEAVSLIF
jgi:hypothetical protein